MFTYNGDSYKSCKKRQINMSRIVIESVISWIQTLNGEMARKCVDHMKNITTNIFGKDSSYLEKLENALRRFEFSNALGIDSLKNWNQFKSELSAIGDSMLKELESSKTQ